MKTQGNLAAEAGIDGEVREGPAIIGVTPAAQSIPRTFWSTQ